VSREVASYFAESAEQNRSFEFPCSSAAALLTEPEHAEAILRFGSIGPNRLLSLYRVKWGC